MPEIGKLSAHRRNAGGKGEARRTRTGGRLPAVCYGKGTEPIAISIDPVELRGALDPDKRQNTLIQMTIQGEAAPRDVLLRDVQKDPITEAILHADFQAVRRDEEVRVTVPIVLVGKPEGVKLGGILHQAFRQMEIACVPERIPARLEMDVSSLLIGQGLHISDLAFGEGVRPLVDTRASVASVVAPKEEKTATETAAEAAATAEAAAGEAAAAAPGAAPGAAPAPAAGAAPGAAPAAKTEEKGKKK